VRWAVMAGVAALIWWLAWRTLVHTFNLREDR